MINMRPFPKPNIRLLHLQESRKDKIPRRNQSVRSYLHVFDFASEAVLPERSLDFASGVRGLGRRRSRG